MNLLYTNDRRGQYPQSWYAATADALPPFAPLTGATRADVCIVGGGYTGLSAALHLAEAGVDVALVEAHRVGFGASGRNGGQLGSGQRQDQLTLEKMVGDHAARRMWDLGEDAKATVRDLIDRHNIDCAIKPGVAWAATSTGSYDWMRGYADHMDRAYGYQMQAFAGDDFAQICPSPAYCGGILDMGAAHLHPLKLAQGIARAAHTAGARLFENSTVTRIDEGERVTVHTQTGQIEADHLILATGGYLGGLDGRVAAKVMPINNFIVATDPLGDAAKQVLARDIAVADDLFVVNYFRLSEDGRLLFGGGESYGYRFPSDIRATVRKPLTRIFPHLRTTPLPYAWGGTLSITMKRLPHLERLGRNVLSASGYSGHGVGNAVQAGRFLAEAVQGQSDGFDAFAALPTPSFPGGAALRNPLLVLAMSWFALRDRLGL
ncbi:NAD(P)/FAD-dependent oxidoreductase [Sagittula sp. SSi028]|uniref:NAD(P)/FAD-dependent oxidoreductase n=1 Tax=Sagittula sp. SSi028 TaxID=3400636 RepID=UPI003AF8C235